MVYAWHNGFTNKHVDGEGMVSWNTFIEISVDDLETIFTILCKNCLHIYDTMLEMLQYRKI